MITCEMAYFCNCSAKRCSILFPLPMFMPLYHLIIISPKTDGNEDILEWISKQYAFRLVVRS